MRKRKKKTSYIPLLVFASVFGGGSFLVYNYIENKTYSINLILEAIPVTFNSHGIDVSHHQNTIDWEMFKDNADSLIKFVYCKATEGTHFVDPQWKLNRSRLTHFNITHGAYHFFNPELNPLKQANHFLTYYKHKQNDLPPVLDAETKGTSNIELIESMKLWLTHVEYITGKRPVIYTSYYFYNTKFKNAFNGYKFWIANYSNTPNRLKHKDIIHWQYSDSGNIPGIKGNVDLNFSKVKF